MDDNLSIYKPLTPFPFHQKLRDYFKKQTKTWAWFSDIKTMTSQSETFKTDLLKNSYRIDQEIEPKIYEILEIAKNKLGVLIPITIYQSQHIENNNASIVILEKEAHLVMSGTLLKLLDESELLALLSHELSHISLFQTENGDFEITNRIINSISNDSSSELYYNETARIYQLYTELYCDLGAFKVCGDIQTVISTLVKINTGLDKISPESYLKQANEILSRIEAGSEGETHPEIYIRAKSLELYQESPVDYFSKIETIVNGKKDIYQLNLFSKEEVSNTTKELIDVILKPKWTQSEHNIILYKQYYQTYNRKSDAFITPEFKLNIENSKKSLKDYYSYVMLDFALCDNELKDPFLGHILDISEQIGLEENLKAILKKELSLSDKAYKEMHTKCATELNKILESEQENTY